MLSGQGSNSNSRQQSIEALLEELEAFCTSESLSEDGLRDIIERHELTPQTNIDVPRYDFFRFACRNEGVTEGIIRCLLEYFPDAAKATDNDGQTPLHFVCRNPNVTLNIVQLLIDAAPDKICSVDNIGRTPLHYLCRYKEVDEMTAIEIMRLLIEKCPEAVRHYKDNNGSLPIHLASFAARSPEFYRVLIEAYPGSERITNVNGAMPLHFACMNGAAATIEYLYKLYPDAINHATRSDYGEYPIHVKN